MPPAAPADEPAREIHLTVPWHGKRAPELSDCEAPWNRIDVTNGGEVLACCFTQETLGNVLRDGLDAVLNGERRRQLQEDVRRNRINPGCLNAACMYAPMSVRRPWTVHFPADRFTIRDKLVDGVAVYEPSAGDGLFAEGPARFLPAAHIEAAVEFSRTRPSFFAGAPAGKVRVEVMDERGLSHGETTRGLSWRRKSTLRLPFSLPEVLRYRFGFRIWLTGIHEAVRFHGVTLKGTPIEAGQ